MIPSDIVVKPLTSEFFGPNDGECRYEQGKSYAYPDAFWESIACFEAKIKLFPQGCIALANLKNELIGYAVGHPWSLSLGPVALNIVMESLPSNPDCFYIHDVAVIDHRRGQGLGKFLAQKILDVANEYHFHNIKLVSVNNSESFWQKFGFTIVEHIDYCGSPGIIMVMDGARSCK